jgi:hypothetical protein
MFNTLMTMINVCEDDVYFGIEQNTIYLTVDDSFDFDEEGNEIMRDYDHPKEVSALLDWLDNNCISRTDNLYVIYSFNGFTVHLGFASFDI